MKCEVRPKIEKILGGEVLRREVGKKCVDGDLCPPGVRKVERVVLKLERPRRDDYYYVYHYLTTGLASRREIVEVMFTITYGRSLEYLREASPARFGLGGSMYKLSGGAGDPTYAMLASTCYRHLHEPWPSFRRIASYYFSNVVEVVAYAEREPDGLEDWMKFRISTRELLNGVQPEPPYEEGSVELPHEGGEEEYLEVLRHIPLAENERKFFAKIRADPAFVVLRTLPYASKFYACGVKYGKSQVTFSNCFSMHTFLCAFTPPGHLEILPS